MIPIPAQITLSDFKHDFAGSAFKTINGERRIVGKFCEVTILNLVIKNLFSMRCPND